ncbi:MAG: hypothetical protein H0W64_12665 [Gammaproteobacteria bacterium]|nr:hypothetical protein [Gammaproteobacteria bacterium]
MKYLIIIFLNLFINILNALEIPKNIDDLTSLTIDLDVIRDNKIISCRLSFIGENKGKLLLRETGKVNNETKTPQTIIIDKEKAEVVWGHW